MRLGALACACMLALGLVLAGCGGNLGGGGVVGLDGDAANGKQLFVERCGSCHTMADAGTAGTVTTLAALDLGLPAYDAARVHGHRLTRATVERLLARLGALGVDERARLP